MVVELHIWFNFIILGPIAFHVGGSRYKTLLLLLHMRTIYKVYGLILLLQAGTLWRCSDSLFFEVPPLASDALPAMFHPLLKNMLQTIDYFEICLGAPFSWLEKPRNHMR
jgi:hypothetical protein